MTSKLKPHNPYIAGKAIGKKQGFFGRKDILQLVETEMSSPERSAVVLFGQRRIGKTSILLQLQQRLPSPPFVTFYFDLMDRAKKPLGSVLFDLASTIAAETGISAGKVNEYDNEGLYFRQKFLSELYKALGKDQRPIVLFDEFDVLDAAVEERLQPTAAAESFFPYLRQLMEGEPRLGFVFVVGRKPEELSIDVKATFKAARYKKVSVLDEESATELVTTAQDQGTLTFADDAIKRVLSLTSCHPYFTQLVCQLLWDGAYVKIPQTTPEIDSSAVDAIIPKALEAGENIFEWIWDGLPPAERVIFAAIAEATEKKAVVTKDELINILQNHGIRILIRELELAPDTLVKWEMLREIDRGYSFFIELMRLWVLTRKPLPKVKDELDRIVPLADMLYKSGNAFYYQNNRHYWK